MHAHRRESVLDASRFSSAMTALKADSLLEYRSIQKIGVFQAKELACKIVTPYEIGQTIFG